MSGEPSLPKTNRSFEVASDPRFQRRVWRIQRISWLMMALIVAAALAGLFGGGPLSHAEVTDESGAVTIRYERLLRQGAPWSMEVRLLPSGDEAALWIGDDLLATSRVRRIVPEPIESHGGADGTLFRFRAAGRDQALTVRFHFETDAIGLVHAKLGRPGRTPIALRQFIYP